MIEYSFKSKMMKTYYMLTVRQRWAEQYRFARLMTKRWWNVGNSEFPDAQTIAARRQAPKAFKCLLDRSKTTDWGVWHGITGRWFHIRPGHYLPARKLP